MRFHCPSSPVHSVRSPVLGFRSLAVILAMRFGGLDDAKRRLKATGGRSEETVNAPGKVFSSWKSILL